MKKALFIILFVLPNIVLSQSFIFCPEIQTKEKDGFKEVEISFVFEDARLYDKKKKEKCTKEEIFEKFVECIKQTYPNMKVKVLDNKKFYEPPAKGVITVKIELTKYDATFNTGMYRSNTVYKVKMFDLRNNKENIIEQVISGEGKQFNALGFTSAKIASNISFRAAFDNFEVLFDKFSKMLNVQIVEENKVQPSIATPKSKAERLRELKQLLEEKILTQEEFDLEKKKILDEKE